MAKRKYVFKFPPLLTDAPVAERLVRDHDLGINILRARIEPDEEGLLVMELTGAVENINAGIEAARASGVEVHTLDREIKWHVDLCVQCTACRSVCLHGALETTEPEMTVKFNQEKCTACELCIAACPYKAVEIAF